MTMEYRVLGRSGVQVSRLCFGTMSFGGDAAEAESAAMYRACRDAGINFFDTADQYNKGRAEEILGELAAGHRDELVIATKCFNPTGSDIAARGNSRRHIRRAVEASLRRLRTDRISFSTRRSAITRPGRRRRRSTCRKRAAGRGCR
jgi:aryl-alcohol dehydrogenase-like predicted oxidoreductase